LQAGAQLLQPYGSLAGHSYRSLHNIGSRSSAVVKVDKNVGGGIHFNQLVLTAEH
jgi:hypothetical protein